MEEFPNSWFPMMRVIFCLGDCIPMLSAVKLSSVQDMHSVKANILMSLVFILSIAIVR